MKALLILLPILVLGCSDLKPKEVTFSNYSELGELLSKQPTLLNTARLEKKVSLDGKEEAKTLVMDSILWKEELTFLGEMNPNQPEYVGAFREEIQQEVTQLSLKEGETGSLKFVRHQKLEGGSSIIQVVIHEDKDLFVHHRDINLLFSTNGILERYSIEGYQKILMKDTIRFSIKGKVL